MSKTVHHTNKSAAAVHDTLTYEEQIIARNLRWIKARATNELICGDKALVKRVVRTLKNGQDHNFKLVGREHGIPHHTVMFIWREHL